MQQLTLGSVLRAKAEEDQNSPSLKQLQDHEKALCLSRQPSLRVRPAGSCLLLLEPCEQPTAHTCHSSHSPNSDLP